MLLCCVLMPCSYNWVVPVRTQQDCVLDQNRDGNSEFLAITTSLECRWYTVSEKLPLGETTTSPDDKRVEKENYDGSIKLELLATLKATELCNKLRKMDFRKPLLTITY